ncbi:uncharacterized protein SCHCODRAFT_02691660 [Schizophyllum commune H4-8]|nr:uncharacterized protein SCHCODRAFT_02691660 [Schizophyllum commune H4-8]KAI5888246.1 hypothetical protein SCHCODRAFT_02691660 [Schizophyllum commune H4-8]
MSDRAAKLQKLEYHRNAPRPRKVKQDIVIFPVMRTRAPTPAATAAVSREHSRGPADTKGRNDDQPPLNSMVTVSTSLQVPPQGRFVPSPSIPVESSVNTEDQRLGEDLVLRLEEVSSHDDDIIMQDQALEEEDAWGSQHDNDMTMASPTTSEHDDAMDVQPILPTLDVPPEVAQDCGHIDIPRAPFLCPVLGVGAELITFAQPNLEAAHYGPWGLISYYYFGKGRILLSRKCVVSAVPISQYPAGGTLELLDSHKASTKAYLYAKSIRVPDWSQISVLSKPDACIPPDMNFWDWYRTTQMGPMPEGKFHLLKFRCTLLAEIKPTFSGDDGKPTPKDMNRIGKALTQLKNQAHHSFVSYKDTDIIGGLVAFGSWFTYCEVTRNEAAVERAFTDHGGQGYRSRKEESEQDAHEKDEEKEIRARATSPLGIELFKVFKNGMRFVDARTPGGQAVLEKIHLRAMELAPEYYKDSWKEEQMPTSARVDKRG